MNSTILIVVLLIVLLAWLHERGKRRLLQDAVRTRSEPSHIQSASSDGFWLALFLIGAAFILILGR